MINIDYILSAPSGSLISQILSIPKSEFVSLDRLKVKPGEKVLGKISDFEWAFLTYIRRFKEKVRREKKHRVYNVFVVKELESFLRLHLQTINGILGAEAFAGEVCIREGGQAVFIPYKPRPIMANERPGKPKANFKMCNLPDCEEEAPHASLLINHYREGEGIDKKGLVIIANETLYTKLQGQNFLEELLEKEDIDQELFDFLVGQVNESPLPMA